MKRLFCALFAGAILLTPAAPAYANHSRDRCGRYDDCQGDGYGNGSQGDCQSGGCGNRSRRCENARGDCRSSFSPGPFDHSPVTIIICPPGTVNCGSGGGQGDGGGQGQNPQPGERPRA